MSGYEYGPNAGCALQPIVRLTTSSASIKSAIDDMTAVGDTNIPLGMSWGWQMLSPSAPFSDGAPYGTPHLRKIIILMTDGDNTMGDPASSWEQNKSSQRPGLHLAGDARGHQRKFRRTERQDG